MTYLIDTDVAVHLRDGTREIVDRLAMLGSKPSLSLLTVVELEGGIVAIPELAVSRRAALNRLLATVDVEPFEAPMVDAYAAILSTWGYSRRRVIDRLIAATAMVNGLTLVTINPDDFREVPGLDLLAWSPPAQ